MDVLAGVAPALAAYLREMIDHDAPTPIYRQMADILRSQIASGELVAGRRIPSVVNLQQTYGIARGSVLHALRLLTDEGLLVVVTGRGTFVAEPKSQP